MTDSDFGRVADDGTVYVLLPDGTEHKVGQWAAGDPSAGLAHYRRRYEDLVVEVTLTSKRLKSGAATPEQALAVVTKIRGSLAEPAFVGDIAGLEARLTSLEAAVAERRGVLAEQKKAAREAALARRTEIADEAETMAQSTQWKASGERYRALLDEWKALPRFDKGAEQVQWERFSAARSVFDKRRRQHFAELDATRAEAVTVKRELIRRAEALATSTEWGPTSRAYRDLMAEWKAAPRAGRAEDDKLWTEFRAAQDKFFAARNEADSERSADESKNLAAKLEILAKAEALVPAKDHRAARAELSRLMEQRDATAGLYPATTSRVWNVGCARWRCRCATRRRITGAAPTPPPRIARSARSSRSGHRSPSWRRSSATAEASGDERAIADAQSSLESSRALLGAAEAALAEYSSN